MTFRNRLYFTLGCTLASASFVAVGIAACSTETLPIRLGDVAPDATSLPPTDASTTTSDGALVDSGDVGDAGVDATADAPSDASKRDANGSGEAGAPCTLNYDCQSALRCECALGVPCECKAGARGAGRNGLDACNDDGNACISALCVEGPADAGFFCSDECDTSADCTGQLPTCKTVAFFGRICVRTP